MWEEETSITRKENSNFSIHLFCWLWHNFDEHIIELPKCFAQFSWKDIKHKMFSMPQSYYSCWFIFIFNVLNQFLKVSFTNYGKYTDLQTDFSEKNIWHSSQVFPGIAVPKFQGSRSVLKCDKMWLFERNLPSKHSSLSYIIRFGFQTKILKEIHNNYSEL